MNDTEVRSAYLKRFRVQGEDATNRAMQPGGSHTKQLLMSAIGYELEVARTSTRRSDLSSIANLLHVDEPAVLLAEKGCLDPEVFFEILPAWANIFLIDSEKLIARIENELSPDSKKWLSF